MAAHRNCGSACRSCQIITDPDRGEMICSGCGSVLEQRLVDTLEDCEDSVRISSRARTGPATSLVLHDRGLATTMGRDADHRGRGIYGRARYDLRRMRVLDRNDKISMAPGLAKPLALLDATGRRLNLSVAVLEDAARIYRRAYRMRVAYRTMGPTTCAALYAACRMNHTMRTMSDIVAAGGIERHELVHALWVMTKQMDLTMERHDTDWFVTRVANNLGLPERIKRDALSILRRAGEMNAAGGRSPATLAAAALYLADDPDHNISQTLFAREAGVTHSVVSLAASLLRRRLHLPKRRAARSVTATGSVSGRR